MSEPTLEAYVSERSSLIVEGFLFAEKLNDDDSSSLEAIKNAFAVLVSQQLSAAGEVDIVPATIEKIESMKQSNLVSARCSLLKTYYEHFLASPRGQLSLPSPAPLLLPVALVSHVLRLSTFMLSKRPDFNQQLYFTIVREARTFAQKLSRASEAYSRSRWLEGLCYVWQAIGAKSDSDETIRMTILGHAKKLLIEGIGTNIYETKITGLDALENPCSAVVGALCDYMGSHVESLWWYRKYRAENAIFSFDDLLPELATYLSPLGESYSTALLESREDCLEQVSLRKYLDIVKLQSQINATNKFKSATPSPAPYEAEPEEKLENPYVVSIPIGVGRSKAAGGGDGHKKSNSDDLEYAASPPKSSMDLVNIRKSIYVSEPTSQPVTTVNTSQFLERSRAILERSYAHTFMPTTPSPIIPLRSSTPEYSLSIDSGTGVARTDSPAVVISPDMTHVPVIVSPVPAVIHPVDLQKPATPVATDTDPSKTAISDPATPSVPVQPEETIQERLKRRITLYGLREEKEVPGDGNCQFYSLSDQLYNDFKHAAQIRNNCVQWLWKHGEMELENGAKLKEFGFNDDGWDAYLAIMSLPGTWGDHLTLVACAELFHVRIVIVTSAADESQAVIEIVPTTTGKDSATLPTIYLCHYAEFHYGTLREFQDS